MTTPNDPLFGSTPADIVAKVQDGTYAAEVLARSDEAGPAEAATDAGIPDATPAPAPAPAPRPTTTSTTFTPQSTST